MIQHKITLVKRREAVGMNHTSMLFLAVKVFGVPLMSEYTYVVQIMSHRHHQKVVRISRRAVRLTWYVVFTHYVQAILRSAPSIHN